MIINNIVIALMMLQVVVVLYNANCFEEEHSSEAIAKIEVAEEKKEILIKEESTR
jgi:hypothetical protein